MSLLWQLMYLDPGLGFITWFFYIVSIYKTCIGIPLLISFELLNFLLYKSFKCFN